MKCHNIAVLKSVWKGFKFGLAYIRTDLKNSIASKGK